MSLEGGREGGEGRGGRGGEGRGGEGRGGERRQGGRGWGGRGGMTVIHIILMAPYIYRPTMKNYMYITMTSRIT